VPGKWQWTIAALFDSEPGIRKEQSGKVFAHVCADSVLTQSATLSVLVATLSVLVARIVREEWTIGALFTRDWEKSPSGAHQESSMSFLMIRCQCLLFNPYCHLSKYPRSPPRSLFYRLEASAELQSTFLLALASILRPGAQCFLKAFHLSDAKTDL
jgi:hypothetical protein